LLFFFFYGALTLVTGTVFGLAHPVTSGITTALVVATILAGVWKRPAARLCPGDDLAVAGFLAITFLTAIFSICPARSIHLAVPFVGAAMLFYLVLDSRREQLAGPMAAVATVAAIIGLSAWLTGATPRVTAPFAMHHYAAGFLLLHLPITWALVQEDWRNWRWLAALALQAGAIAGTRSLAGIAALALMILWTLRRKPVLLIAALAAIAAIVGTVPRTREMLTRGEDRSLSLENRLRYVETGVAMLKARPLGWGLGSVPLVSAPYRPQTPDVMPQGEVLPHLHNLPLQLAVETGLFGLIAGGWFLFRARSPAIAPYLLFALFDYQLDIPALLFACAAVAGLSAKSTLHRPPGKVWQIALLCAAAMAPVASMCGWDDFVDARYTDAAARLPDLIPLSAAAGAWDVDQRKYGEAIPYLERAEKLDPYFTLAWFHHGRALGLLGDRDGAADAFAQAMLTHPATIFAEGWGAALYSAAQQRAIAKLDGLHAKLSPDARTEYRFKELRAFLGANPTPPPGEFRVPYSEITDADFASSTSLLVFHRPAPAKTTSTIYVMLPRPDFYIPPGIGYLRLR